MQEFDLNNYRYEVLEQSYTDWLRSYLPTKNEIIADAKLDGILFEHEGEQWEFIKTQSAQQLWSLIRQEDGRLVLRNGYAGVRGLQGYVFCQRRSDLRQALHVYVTEEQLAAGAAA